MAQPLFLQKKTTGAIHTREIQAAVEVARAGGAVTEVDERHEVVSAKLRRPGEAHGLRDLRPHGRAHRRVVLLTTRDVVRHLAAVHHVPGIAEQVVHVRLQIESAYQGGSLFPVAGEHPVLLPHGVGRRADGGLLTLSPHVETDPALALQREQPVVDHPRLEHGLVETHDLRRLQPGVPRGIQRSIVTHHSNHRVWLGHELGVADC